MLKAPLRISALEEAPPKTTGVPSRTICAKTIPASISAFWSARLPASVDGPVAPAMARQEINCACPAWHIPSTLPASGHHISGVSETPEDQ